MLVHHRIVRSGTGRNDIIAIYVALQVRLLRLFCDLHVVKLLGVLRARRALDKLVLAVCLAIVPSISVGVLVELLFQILLAVRWHLRS